MAVYTGLEATLHEAFWGDRGSDLEVSELLRLFPDFQGKALEVGAGSGRILSALLESGWDVMGIEPSAEMVSMFGDSERMEQVTLEEYEPGEKYDLILLPSFVFMLFPSPMEVFTKVESLLAEGGHVYFSWFIPWAEIVGEMIEGEWSVDDEVKLPEGQKGRCWVNFELDRVRQRLTRKHRYELLERKKVLKVTKTQQDLRWYGLPEMELMVKLAGFAVSKYSYDFSAKYDSDAHILGLVLERG